MNKSKKIIIAISIIVVIAIVSVVAIMLTQGKNKRIKGNLEDIMSFMYQGIPEDEKPMMLTNFELDEENVEGFLGTTDIEFEEGIASESGIGSIAHSVVLLRTKKGANVEAVKKQIEDNINPRKWICVEAEKCIVKSKGDLIIVIMTNSEDAQNIESSFDDL